LLFSFSIIAFTIHFSFELGFIPLLISTPNFSFLKSKSSFFSSLECGHFLGTFFPDWQKNLSVRGSGTKH